MARVDKAALESESHAASPCSSRAVTRALLAEIASWKTSAWARDHFDIAVTQTAARPAKVMSTPSRVIFFGGRLVPVSTTFTVPDEPGTPSNENATPSSSIASRVR